VRGADGEINLASFFGRIKFFCAGTFSIFHLHPSGAAVCSPVRPFNWVNKQANNQRFLTENKFRNNKKWQILGTHTPPDKKNVACFCHKK
jgi:hypothetical protein